MLELGLEPELELVLVPGLQPESEPQLEPEPVGLVEVPRTPQ